MTSHNPMIETNDPRLTDYVLGELAPSEVAQIEAALKSSPELRAAVADIRAATETITSVFQAEPSLQLSPEQKAKLLAEAESANTDVHSFADNVIPSVAVERYRPSSGSTAHWIKIAVAAGLAGLLLGGAYYFTKTDRLPMAASENSVHDSVAEPEESKSLTGEDDEDKDLAQVFEQPAAQQFKAVKPDRVDPFSDHTNPVTSDGIQTQKLIAKEAPPRATGLRQKRRDAKKQSSLPRSVAMPTPDNEDAPAKMDFAKEKSVVSENNEFNSPMLLRAQQSLDQSPLGSLNLKVVAQNTPTPFGQQKGGLIDDVIGDQPTKIYKPPAKNNAVTRGPIPSSPTTLKLQISDQTAKQMVQLLANQADPLQQRKLSFNELIGLRQSQLAESAVRENHLKGSLKLEADSTAFDDNRVQKKSKTSPVTSQDAALTLAAKLRKHVSRQRRARELPPGVQLAPRSPAAILHQANKGSRLNVYNFDYTQIIQQLESNLEIRNQSVNLPKPNESPARKLP